MIAQQNWGRLHDTVLPPQRTSNIFVGRLRSRLDRSDRQSLLSLDVLALQASGLCTARTLAMVGFLEFSLCFGHDGGLSRAGRPTDREIWVANSIDSRVPNQEPNRSSSTPPKSLACPAIHRSLRDSVTPIGGPFHRPNGLGRMTPHTSGFGGELVGLLAPRSQTAPQTTSALHYHDADPRRALPQLPRHHSL